MDFCGGWKSNGKVFLIQKNEKTFTCSLPGKNIGLIFNNDLVVSEFEDTAQRAGIGIYSPIGDGGSIYALWSSVSINGQLGSGIGLKCDESPGLEGEYNVRYFVRNQERGLFFAEIERTGNESIYKLSWYVDNKKVLHGIGFLIKGSLAIAWGDINHKFDINRFCYGIENGTEKLKRQTVRWDSLRIESNDYIKVP